MLPEYLDLSNWDLKNCTGFDYALQGCSKLKTLRINDYIGHVRQIGHN